MTSPLRTAVTLGILTILALARPVLAQTTFQGKLDAKQPSQSHKVKLEAGKVYQLDMTSKDFDTNLFLNDAAGKPLAQNDDIEPGVNLNSRILYIPTATAEYHLVATSFNKAGQGAYTITVQKLKPSGTAQRKEGRLDDKSPLFGDKKLKIPYQPFRFQMEAGAPYQIDVVAKNFVGLVAIRKAGEARVLAGDTGSGEGRNARLLFLPRAAGQYEILVSAFDKKFGDFQLTVQKLQSEGPGPVVSNQ